MCQDVSGTIIEYEMCVDKCNMSRNVSADMFRKVTQQI